MKDKKDLKILIGCEQSGTIREEFIKLGYTNTWSCDVIESDIPGNHIVQSVLEVIYQGWDMAILHPPCTHLAVSGAKHFKKKIALGKQQAALDFIRILMNAPIKHIAIENPISVISSKIRKPDQIIQPWQFGDKAQKTTCLWLKNLPLLEHTEIVSKGEFYISPSGKKLPKWYSDNKSSKSRSKTFMGIARAVASQWGQFLLDENSGINSTSSTD